MGQIVELGLDNYSHLSQRAELINVTQVPTNSGNAQVQLATFPKVKQKTDAALNLIDESRWLAEGEKFLDVQMAFNWIVYLVELNRDRSSGSTEPIRYQVRARNLTDPNRAELSFEPYAPPINNVEPLQVVEFVDLNANRWVVINTYSASFNRNKTVKFLNESDFSPSNYDFSDYNPLTVLPGTFEGNGSDAEANKFYEIFIEGTYFEDYKFLRDFSMSGFIATDYDKQEDQTWIWRVTSEGTFRLSTISVNELNALKNSIKNGDLTSVFTKELQEVFQTKLLHDQINDYETDGADGDRPATMRWYDGFQMLSWLLTSISDEENRKKRDYVNDADVAIWLTSIGTSLIAAGGYLFASSNPVGWIAGAIAAGIGGITWVLGSYFEEDYIDSFRVNNGGNAIDGMGFFEICDTLKKTLGMGTMTNGTIRSIDNVQVLESDTAFAAANIDAPLPMTDGNSLGVKLVAVLDSLDKLVRWKEANPNATITYAWYLKNTKDEFDEAARNTLNSFLNAFINGGWCQVPKRVVGASAWDSSYTDGWQSIYFTGMRHARDVIKSHLLNFYNGDKSGEIKELFRTINNNLKFEIIPKTKTEEGETVASGEKGLIYIRDRLNSLLTEIQDDDRFTSSERDDLETRITRAKNSLNEIDNSCSTMISWLESQFDTTYYRLSIFDEAERKLKYLLLNGFSDALNTLAERIIAIKDFLINFRDDYHIFDIESLAHMLVVITTDDRFYYSDAGTTTIQGVNFYSAEYANSSPVEAWRLANRLVLFTNNTVEFWDVTNDFEDPLSPAYSSNVYSLTVLQNTRVKYNDTLYFIAKPVELDSYSVYKLSKNGQLEHISNPQLDDWINKQITTVLSNYNPLDINLNYNVRSSVIDYEHVPIIQWHLSDRALNLNYNVMFNTFFLSDELYFLNNLCYFQLNSNIAGTLNNYFNNDGTAIEAIIKTVNTNFDPKKRYKSVSMFHGNVDLQDDRNFKDDTVTRSNGLVQKVKKAHWSKPLDFGNDSENYQSIKHKFFRVSKMPWESLREVRLQPKQGNRNVNYRIIGIGLGIDFQTELRWNGFLRVNSLAYEVE